jgi:lipoprotein-anchoring transpeptidase ErfK/SrfK
MQRARQMGTRAILTTLGTAAVLTMGATAYTYSPTAAADTTADERNDPPTLWLHADLSERKLTIEDSTGVVREYTIAVGQPAYPTPPGEYKISKIIWNPSWTPPPNSEWAKRAKPKKPGDPGNPMKLVKIFFREPDYYIHGTDDLESLGKAESHGCLRMDPFDAADVAKYVMEHGGQPREESWFWRVLHFYRDEKTVYLKNPIPITVEP